MKQEQLKERIGELNLVDTVFEADGVSYIDTVVSVMQVYDLIDQLDEREKVVIPQFVAETFEKVKGSNFYAGQLITAMYEYSDEVAYWLEVPSNEKLLLRAWLNGYEVKELPVIPQFVADWWERDDDSVTMYGRLRVEKKHKFDLISIFYDKGLGDYLSKVEDWIYENDSAFLDLVNGKPYEIEKEKLYWVLDKEGCVLVKKYTDGTSLIKSTGIKPERFPEWQQNDLLLTEKEIKDYDERYLPFMVPINEVNND